MLPRSNAAGRIRLLRPLLTDPAKSRTASITERTATTPRKAVSSVLKSCCRLVHLPSQTGRPCGTRWKKAERGKKAQLAYSFDIALRTSFHAGEHRSCNAILLEQFGAGVWWWISPFTPLTRGRRYYQPAFSCYGPSVPCCRMGKWVKQAAAEYLLDENEERIQD